jgi:polyhydroxybutyrate depolymerase
MTVDAHLALPGGATTRRRSLGIATALCFLLATGCGSGSASRAERVQDRAPRAPVAAQPSPGCRDRRRAPATNTEVGRQLDVAGMPRTYRLTRSSQSRPAPLIVLFHGFASSAEDIDRASHLPDRARAVGAVVATPDAAGTQKLWQPTPGGDDAAFVDTLVAHLEATECIDTKRIALVGFSAGAAFAAAYACAHPDRIAAIATVSVEFPFPCTRPMPILAFHGTADPIVPYEAGAPSPIGPSNGTDANMARWASISHCRPRPATAPVSDTVTVTRWSGCTQGSDVVLYKIIGGAHAWPTDTSPGSVTPRPKLDAAGRIFAFVDRHPRRR